VIGLTKSAALDYVPGGIRVNAVAPEPILTDGGIGAAPGCGARVGGTTLPLKRIGSLREVAQVVAWLPSDAALFVNGISVSIVAASRSGLR
jgi:NAD(P)-dependent dehydrogenase (short-subunit alcohol dehydrogenase family)